MSRDVAPNSLSRWRGAMVDTMMVSGLALAVAATPVMGLGTAHAADWLGGSGNFNLGSNWAGGTVPADTATFTNSPTAERDVTVTSSSSLSLLEYNNDALRYTLSTAPGLALLVGDINNNSAFEQTLFAGAAGGFTISGTIAGAMALIADSGGAMQFGAGTSASGSRFIGQGGFLNLNMSAGETLSIGSIEGTGIIRAFGPQALSVGGLNSSTTYAGRIQDSVALIKVGSGALTLSGDNLYTGGTTINAGSIIAGNDSVFSTGSVLLNGGTLATTGARSIGNSVTLTGSGTIRVLDTTATFSGPIATGGHSLSLEGAGSGTISGIISGSGTVTKGGAGAFTLSGANTYTGATTINGGTLIVNGSLASSSVSVGSGTTLGGSGSIAGAVTVTAGGTLSAGNSPGTLTVGSLTLDSGSNTVFELGTPGVAGGPTNDHIIVNGTGPAGNLTLGGTLTATAASAGYYRLFDVTGGGTISGNFTTVALTAPSVPGASGIVYSMPAGMPPQVNLAVIGSGQTMQFWDGADQAGNGAVDGGTGTWNSGNTNWAVAPGETGFNAPWLGSVGVFQGAAGTITVSGAQDFDTLQFNTNGYALNGGALSLGVAGGGTINTATGVTATINSDIIDGAGSRLTKVGAGTLLLSGNNTYGGGTSLLSGTLGVSSANALGTGALLMAANTKLITIASLSLNNPFTLAGGTASIDTNTFDLDLNGPIDGVGTLAKIGLGTLTLSGANTYTGATWIQHGTLRMGGTGTLSNQTAVQVSAGAVFDLGGIGQTIGSLSGTGDVLVGGATLIAGGNNSSTTFGGTISGAGSLLKAGTGTLTLNGTNTYTSVTQVLGGSLVVDGSVVTPVIVHPGATLGGSGSVGATTIGGTLSPGNSPGTLTVNGDLVMGAGSLYLAEIQGAVADRVNVTGTASLAGTLRLVPLGGAYSFNSPYTLLSAAGGTSGVFRLVDTAGSFGDGVTTTVSYSISDVQLTLKPKPLAPIVDPVPPTAPGGASPPRLGVGRPANAYAVASAIDGAVANGADASPLFNLYNLPAAAIPAAVNQLSGEMHTAVPALGFQAANQFLGTMLDSNGRGRLAGAAGGPNSAAGFVADLPSKLSAAGPSSFDPARFSLWGATFGSRGRTEGEPDVGSANRTLDDAHLAVGADILLAPGTVAGVAIAGGQARASLSGGLGKIESDVFQAGLYGRTRLGQVELAAAAGYARLDNDVHRPVPVLGNALTSSYASTAWSGRLQASAQLLSWNGISVSPLAALQAVQVRSPAFAERTGLGGNAGALSVARRNGATSRSEVGVQFDGQAMFGAVPVTGFVRAAWAHYFERDASLAASLIALPGASFTANGARPDRDSALLAAGADIKLSQSVSLGMRVDSELSGNTGRVGGTAQLRVNF